MAKSKGGGAVVWRESSYCQNEQSCRHPIEKAVPLSNLQKGDF